MKCPRGDGGDAVLLAPPEIEGDLRSWLNGLEPQLPGLRSFPEVVLVTEGAARNVVGAGAVTVVAARGSGDDAIVEVVAARRGGSRGVLVVTADRELRERVSALGASTLGPRSLLDLIHA